MSETGERIEELRARIARYEAMVPTDDAERLDIVHRVRALRDELRHLRAEA